MKIFALTYNELIKQLKGKGTKAILGLLVILAVILPLGIKMFPKETGSESVLERTEFLLEESKSIINNTAYQNSDEGKIKIALAKGEVEYYSLETEAKVGAHENYGHDDWRIELSREFKRLACEIEALQLIMNGMPREVLMSNIYNVNPEVLTKAYDSTFEQRQQLLKELQTKKEALSSIILNEDYMGYLEQVLVTLTKDIESQKQEIVKLNKELEKSPQSEEIKTTISQLETKILTNEGLLKVHQYRYDHKIDFTVDNWKSKTLESIKSAITEKAYPMFDKEEYQRQVTLGESILTYDEYVETYKAKQAELDDLITLSWYSLEENIPQLDKVTDARTVVDSSVNIFILAASIVIIIVGGGIIANEFSSGTIRLLLIRPVSRIKVLIGKLLSLVVLGTVIVVATTALSLVTSGILFGFETLMIPILSINEGTIVTQSFMLFLLHNILVSSVSLIFMIALVFSLSTLTKNTAIAVALSIVLYLGAVPLSMMMATSVKMIGNTFLPFINQPMLNLSAETIEVMKEQSGVVFNQGFGLIQLMMLAIILVGVSFIVFSKKDVKN